MSKYGISPFILLAEKFSVESDWLRQAVFQPNLKYLHVEITVDVAKVETVSSCC